MPITAPRYKLHRRQPFIEVATIQKVSDGHGDGEALYMGSMPGEFRERHTPAWKAEPFIEESIFGGYESASHKDDPTSNGWDADITVSEAALVLETTHVQALARVINSFQAFLQEHAVNAQIRTHYRAGGSLSSLMTNKEGSSRKQTLCLTIDSLLLAALAPTLSQEVLAIDFWDNIPNIDALKNKLAPYKHISIALNDIHMNAATSQDTNTELISDIQFWAAHGQADQAPCTPNNNPREDNSLALLFSIDKVFVTEHDPTCTITDCPVFTFNASIIYEDGNPSQSSDERSPPQLSFVKGTTDSCLKLVAAPICIDLTLHFVKRMSAYGVYMNNIESTAGQQQRSNTSPKFHPPSSTRDDMDSIHRLLQQVHNQRVSSSLKNNPIYNPVTFGTSLAYASYCGKL